MSCRWPTGATTKTITSQQGANPEGAGNGTPELCGVGHRCDSQFFCYVEMWHFVAGLVTLTRHSLSDLDLTWTKSRYPLQVNFSRSRRISNLRFRGMY
jgi:hypothetical protein